MLVLTRKSSESIRIGDDIIIKVIQTGRGTVKLGIAAPANVRVLRAELELHASNPLSEKAESLSQVAIQAEHEPSSDDDCYHAYSTEYAMDVEDQMACVATD